MDVLVLLGSEGRDIIRDDAVGVRFTVFVLLICNQHRSN